MPLDSSQLLQMHPAELDALFRAGEAGPIPDGPAAGTALIAPGSVFSPEIAELVKLFEWKGKTFDAAAGTLTNRLSPLGVSGVAARVFVGPSVLDGKDCIVLDYSQTSLIAHWVRDEIRRVAPKLYLGKAYLENAPFIDFCLDFN